MSHLKAKQIAFTAANQLIIGNGNGGGKLLTPGTTGQILKMGATGLEWSVSNILASANGLNKIELIDDKGIAFFVEGQDGTGSYKLIDLVQGADNNNHVKISNTANAVTMYAEGDTADVDLVLMPKGNGDVIIGTLDEALGTIQSDDETDLLVKGGDNGGNLFLTGGSNGGKIYYAADALDPLKEVATVGTVQTQVREATKNGVTKAYYAGDAVITLPEGYEVGTVEVFVNGAILMAGEFSVDATSRVLSYVSSEMGYTVDGQDEVLVKYVKFA